MIALWKNSHKHIGYVFFGIAVITMFLFSLFELSICCMKCYSQAMLKNKKFDFSVTNITQEQQNSLERYCSDRGIKDFFSYSEADTLYPGGGTEPFVLAGISGDSKKIGEINFIQGRIPSKPYEICIEKIANDSLDIPYSIGDTISVHIRKKKKELRIVGITSEFSFSGNYIFYSNKFSDVFTSSSNNKLNYVQLLVDENYDDARVSSLVMGIEKNIKGISSSNIVWNDSKLNLYNEKGSYKSISLAIKSLNIVIVLFGVMFLCGELYNLYLFRKKTYEIMRCLGCSVHKIITLLTYEMLLLGCLGMMAGFFAGILLNKLVVVKILKCFFPTTVYGDYSPNYENIFFCIGIVVGIIIFSICILFLHLRKTQPVDNRETVRILRRNPRNKSSHISKTRSVLKTYILKESKLTNFFSLLQFTIIACSFFISIIVASVVNGYQKQEFTLDQKFPLQISVGADGSKMFLSKMDIEHITDLEGVSEVCAEYSGADLYAEVDGKKVKTFIYSKELMDKSEVEEELWDKGVIYIGSSISNTAMLHASPEFTKRCKGLAMETSIKMEHLLQAKTTYFAKDYEDGIIIISEKFARQLGIPQSTYNTVCVRTGYDFQQTKTKIIEYLGGTSKVFVFDAYSQEKENLMIKGMIALALYIVIILALSIFSIVSLTYHYRYIFQFRDLGILRAMGMPMRKVSIVFNLSGCAVTAKAILVSSVIAIPFCKWLLNAFYGWATVNIWVYLLVALIYMLYIFCYGTFIFRVYNKNLTVNNQMIDAE